MKRLIMITMAAILNGFVDSVAFAVNPKIDGPDLILPGGVTYNQAKLSAVLLQPNADGTIRAQLIDKNGGLHIGVIGESGFVESRTVLPVFSGYAPDDFIYIKKINKKAVVQFGLIVAKNLQYKEGNYHLEYVDTSGHSGQINVKKSK